MEKDLQMSLKCSFVVYLRLKITLHNSKLIKLLHSQKETQKQLQRTDLSEYSKTQQKCVSQTCPLPLFTAQIQARRLCDNIKVEKEDKGAEEGT